MRDSVCFNEAPALRGGNLNHGLCPSGFYLSFNEAPALRGGNQGGAVRQVAAIRASMRPPHCAGEITVRDDGELYVVAASMRPPHCAGEIETGETFDYDD